jgi:ABC-type polysaccharide transport system permease subunit
VTKPQNFRGYHVFNPFGQVGQVGLQEMGGFFHWSPAFGVCARIAERVVSLRLNVVVSIRLSLLLNMVQSAAVF